MSDFYENWMSFWDADLKERQKARKVIHREELNWTKTRQDHKAALLIAPETGFKTLGGITMVAQIPKGWKTGKHCHGEEAIFILKGNGFSIIDGRRYDWEEGACLRIPFGAVHQHFNSGESPVEYFSALAPHFEKNCFLAKYEHLEDCQEYSQPPQHSGTVQEYDEKGNRIVLHKKDASVGHHGEERDRIKSGFSETHPHQMHTVQHGKIVKLMGSYQDFIGDEVEITDIFFDKPKTASEKHAHMEAVLYMLEGEGYSMIDGEKVPWKPGSAVHIQGPQTVHQHFNTSAVESQQLRVHFGVRKFVQPIAKDVFPYLYFEAGRPL